MKKKHATLPPTPETLTVCAGPLGWHRSEYAGHAHMLSKRTHKKAEVDGWGKEAGMVVKYVRTGRQRREGVRKQHGKSAHQRRVTVCRMSTLNMKRPLNQSAVVGDLLFPCFYFKKPWIQNVLTHLSHWGSLAGRKATIRNHETENNYIDCVPHKSNHINHTKCHL